MKQETSSLSPEQAAELLMTLQARFEKHPDRHPGLKWTDLLPRLEAQPEKLWSLFQMESTGGEPDVVGRDSTSGKYLFYDCSAESPQGRRNLCYDRAALDSRKEHKPQDSAVDMAATMGIQILNQAEYAELQKRGSFDTKTSSWLLTPPEIRNLGGAIFGDRRYDHVFTYHNGASSYYGVRGFRGVLRV